MWTKLLTSASGLLKGYSSRTGHSSAPAASRQHRIRTRDIIIAPTWQGAFFFTLLGIMFLGAINYQNSLGIFAALLIFGLMFFSGLETFHNLRDLRLSCGRIEPVYCGETVTVPVIIDNTDQAERKALQFSFGAGSSTNGTRVQSNIAADAHHHLALLIPATSRGRHAIPQLVISTRYSLGMIEAKTTLPVNLDVVVYPKLSTQASEQHIATTGTPAISSNQAGNTEYTGTRQYVPGDSLKRINWKSVAAGKGVLVNEYAEAEPDQTQDWIDWQHYARFGIEERLSQMTSAITAHEKHQQQYGMRLPGIIINPNSGAAHMKQCLTTLACYRMPDDSDNNRHDR